MASQVIGAAKVFDAFGNELSSTGLWKSQFGYAGKCGYQQDADSGLKLLGHRYYDSSTGRFLTRDPIKDGRNWYVYCDSNPISRTDPSGLEYHDPVTVEYDGNEGTLEIFGDTLSSQDDLVSSLLPPGDESNPNMDVDLIILTDKNGNKTYYFLPGGRDGRTRYRINKDGSISIIEAPRLNVPVPVYVPGISGARIEKTPVPIPAALPPVQFNTALHGGTISAQAVVWIKWIEEARGRGLPKDGRPVKSKPKR